MELHALSFYRMGKNPPYSLRRRLMGPTTGREKRSLLPVPETETRFLGRQAPTLVIIPIAIFPKQNRLKFGTNVRDCQQHSIRVVTTHCLIWRDEMWRRPQSQLWILGDFTVNGSISPDLCPCARAFASWICGLRSKLAVWKVWVCHGPGS
jgi:hypothetical protein